MGKNVNHRYGMVAHGFHRQSGDDRQRINVRSACATGALRHAMQQRSLTYWRFRSRVVPDIAGAWWEEQVVDLD